MTGPLPHGSPAHHTYRMANGDIRCTGCPLAVGRPLAMPDYSRASMSTWGLGRLRAWWHVARLRRQYRKIFRDATIIQAYRR